MLCAAAPHFACVVQPFPLIRTKPKLNRARTSDLDRMWARFGAEYICMTLSLLRPRPDGARPVRQARIHPPARFVTLPQRAQIVPCERLCLSRSPGYLNKEISTDFSPLPDPAAAVLVTARPSAWVCALPSKRRSRRGRRGGQKSTACHRRAAPDRRSVTRAVRLASIGARNPAGALRRGRSGHHHAT